MRVEGEGQGYAVALSKLVSELAEQVRVVVEGSLVGEDLVAILVAEGLGFDIEPASVDGGDGAPSVGGDEEIVAYDGDLVLGGGRPDGGVGGAADGALHVNELDDGYANSGGRMEGGGVKNMSSGGRSAKL